MGSYIFKPNNQIQIEGVSDELQRKTIKRIEETLKTENGILCSSCKVALIPVSNKRCNFPFYCKFCQNSFGIKGSYGISDFLNQEDKWLPHAVLQGLIQIELTN